MKVDYVIHVVIMLDVVEISITNAKQYNVGNNIIWPST